MTLRDPREHAAIAVLLSCLGACGARPVDHSIIAEQVAERLCPIQDTCGCDEELLIPQCEGEVEGEVTRNERRALAAGLQLDSSCLEEFLAHLDALASCSATVDVEYPDCLVYYGTAGVDEPCRYYEVFPPMSDCQRGLACRLDACRDLDNPRILSEGEICSETEGLIASGFLGVCDEGLICDSLETRTCIPGEPTPRLPVGSECFLGVVCENDTYCRPPDGATSATEDNPGTCTPPTPEGEPCTLQYECERYCEDGYCQIAPPRLCGMLFGWTNFHEFIEHEASK